MNRNKNHKVCRSDKIRLNVAAERAQKEKEEFHPCFCVEVLNANLSGKDKFGSLIKFLPEIYMLIERTPDRRK